MAPKSVPPMIDGLNRLQATPRMRHMKRMQTRATPRERIARHRAAQRERGLRSVVLWRPDVNDAAYRARLAEDCRHLARLTAEDDAIATDYAELAQRTEGWRWNRTQSGAASWC